jgi:hypothetical protein
MNIEISNGDNEPDLLSRSLTGRAPVSIGPWRGSPARRRARAAGRSIRENRGAANPMQRRCAEPRRRPRFDVVRPPFGPGAARRQDRAGAQASTEGYARWPDDNADRRLRAAL